MYVDNRYLNVCFDARDLIYLEVVKPCTPFNYSGRRLYKYNEDDCFI